MQRLSLPPLEKFAAALRQPATVAERGVAMPFTSPALFAARLRAGPGEAPELVVAHPGGQRAWLVLPWAAALDSCQPTLADQLMMQRLRGRAPTPEAARAACRAVAGTGLLGRAARTAAAASGPAPGPRLLARELAEWRAPMEEDQQRALALAALATEVAAAAQATPDPARRAVLEDGWGLLAALWRVTEPEGQPVLVRRFSAIHPLVPEEVLAWPGCARLGILAPPAHPGPQARFATPAGCEAAVTLWLAHR